MAYFSIRLKNGDYIENNLCNHLDYKDDKYLVCQNKEPDGITTLFMIPHDQIQFIERVDD